MTVLSTSALAAIAALSLSAAQDQYNTKSAALEAIFDEAKVADGFDFNQVKSLGDDITGSVKVAEHVQLKNAELSALHDHIMVLQGAEDAAKSHTARSAGANRLPLPGLPQGSGPALTYVDQVKSLGELVTGADQYKSWAGTGVAGGITLTFDKVGPSDMLAKAGQFETLGTKALMTTAAGFAPEALRIGGFVEAPTRPIQLLDIIPMARTGESSIKYMEETTRSHGAAEGAEGATYNESGFAFTERSSPVQKITDSVPVTDEQLEDAPQMESYLNGRLGFGLRQRLDGQSASGDGSGNNLRGITSVVGVQTHAKGADPVPDAIFKAMTKVRVTGRAVPTHTVMHPNDWQTVRLMRTTDGVYIWGSPSESGPERLWGLPVVQCETITEGTAIVGSFQPAFISLFERRGVDIQVGFVGTQFGEGKRTVRADMRVALVLFRPAAFCTVTGLNA